MTTTALGGTRLPHVMRARTADPSPPGASPRRLDAAGVTDGPCPSRLLRPAVLGAVDGLITTFAVLVSGIVADVDRGSVVLIAMSSLIADGFSMGVSEALSVRSELSLKPALIQGTACLLSFLVAGALPLVAFSLFPALRDAALAAAIAFSLALLLVGALRRDSDGAARQPRRTAAEAVALGWAAGGIACAVALVQKNART